VRIIKGDKSICFHYRTTSRTG